MKIEIGESLGYSYLRHVIGCWLVQTNWKASGQWNKYRHLKDEELERAFREMKDWFDTDGSVLKGTKDFGQFLRQAEIDVVGIDWDGSIHAMDIAFHEAGLNYLGGSDKRVLKKLLRTKLVLDAYHPTAIKRHIYFVSPKVHRGVMGPLEVTFKELRLHYPDVNWHLIANETFINEMLEPTLEGTESVSDTAELFVRSARLLSVADSSTPTRQPRLAIRNGAEDNAGREARQAGKSNSPTLQDIVQGLMHTLLENQRALLSDSDLQNLSDPDYCQEELGLRLGGFPLLRHKQQGRSISGHDRYYRKIYGESHLVSNNWWKRHHLHNAGGLIRLIDQLTDKNTGKTGLAELDVHRVSLLSYLEQSSC